MTDTSVRGRTLLGLFTAVGRYLQLSADMRHCMLQLLFGKLPQLSLLQSDPARVRQIGIEHLDLSASEFDHVNLQIGFTVVGKGADVEISRADRRHEAIEYQRRLAAIQH